MNCKFLIALLVLSVVAAKKFRGSVYKVDNEWVFVDYIDKNCPAFGFFKPTMNVTGWGILRIETNPAYSNEDQSYAAGFLEGILSEDDIHVYTTNIYNEKKPTDYIQGFLDENVEWEKKERLHGDKKYWKHRTYLDLQIDGIYDGYMFANRDKPERKITKWQILYANYESDVGDWNELPHNSTEPPPKWEIDRLDHCTALVRMTDDKQDILMGQNTWLALHTMHRVYKIYDIKLTEEDGTTLIPGHLSGFSSYPARISSGDDYYTIGDHMVAQETTIGNYNPDLYKYRNGSAMMQWARNILANRLAENPKHWCELLARYNNGCYPNEWMVLDYNYFVPGYGLKKDGFWLIDTIPGYYHMEDMSDYLNEKGFFASYNIAFFPDIYVLGGTYNKWKQYGDDYTYKKCRRAQIFDRDIHTVQDLDSMKAIMRYNDFRHDSLSLCGGYPGYTSTYTLACRDDLNWKNGTYPRPNLALRNHVATDAKFTSMKLLKERNAASQIIAGPPYKNVGVFEWKTSEYRDAPHWRLPERYEFPWLEIDQNAKITLLGWEYDY